MPCNIALPSALHRLIDWLIDWLISFKVATGWIGLIDGLLLAWCKFHTFRQLVFPLQLNNPTNLECNRETCPLVSALYKDNGLGGGGGGGGGCWFGYNHIVEHFYKLYKFVWKSNVSLNELDFIFRIIEFPMTEKNTVPMTDFQHKIICNRSSWEKREFYWCLSKMLRVENHWIIITNAQHKMYFAYSSSNFWNCGKLSLKLPNLLFLK